MKVLRKNEAKALACNLHQGTYHDRFSCCLTMAQPIRELLTLLVTKGRVPYREIKVTHLEHALQCAALAQTQGASPSLIVAALLHDIGHLMRDQNDLHYRSVDLNHELRSIPVLEQFFGPAVTEPIRLHVLAKRYLCAVDPSYVVNLSTQAQLSLSLQGGCFLPHQAADFLSQPYAIEAVRLRRWDDMAHVPHCTTPPLEHFVPLLYEVAQLTPEPAPTESASTESAPKAIALATSALKPAYS